MRLSDTPIPLEVPFPVNGIDQSMPRSRQNVLTCTEALNVCGFPPYSDRQGGGKTEGTRRAFNHQFTSASGNNRILGLSSLINAIGAVDSLDTPQNQRLYPDETVSIDAQWVPTGAATAHACTDEEVVNLETDYVRGTPADNPTQIPTNEIAFTVGFTTPTTVPTSTSSVVVSMTYRAVEGAGSDSDSGPDTVCAINIGLDLYVGSTQVVDLDGVALLSEPQSDWVRLVWTLTPANIAAITAADPLWANLRGKVTASTGGRPSCLNTVLDVTQIEIRVPGASSNPTAPSNFEGQVLVANRGRCWVANLPLDMGTDSLPTEEVSNPADTGMTRDRPSIAPFFGKWYAVDGDQSKIIQPPATVSGGTPTVTTWQATNGGTVPANCRLVAVYRGRIVLARQEGSEPNASIWYMSRVLDPLDWDFAEDDGLEPAGTAAVAGTNQFVGQPADAITALIPYKDDYLIFGCAKSMWLMEGDPGDGGRVVNLSQQTGVIGERAWCYDEAGNLWFLGSSGLYRFNRAEGLVNVSGRRLYRVLDRIDATYTQVHLAYNAFRKEVMIFLTPTIAPATATAARYSYTVFQDDYGTHLRYDLLRDAFFYRTFPWSTMGPWSVLEIHGAANDDRTYLLGGNDGYLRRPFEGGYIAGSQRYGTADDMPRAGTATPATTGNCYAITSSYRTAPIEAPDGAFEIHATEITATGTDNNKPLSMPLGAVDWKLLGAQSPAKVCETAGTAALETGRWFASDYDFQPPVMLSSSAGALQLIVAQNDNRDKSWALDRITLWVKRGGRRR